MINQNLLLQICLSGVNLVTALIIHFKIKRAIIFVHKLILKVTFLSQLRSTQYVFLHIANILAIVL